MSSFRTLAACFVLMYLSIFIMFLYWNIFTSYDGINLSSCFNSVDFNYIIDLLAHTVIYSMLETAQVRSELAKYFPILWRIRSYIYSNIIIITYLSMYGWML